MAVKRFLDDGSPLITLVNILRGNQLVRIPSPNELPAGMIPKGSFARIHSSKKGVYTVWILDDRTSNTVIVEVPGQLMPLYFEQYEHEIFPHLAI